jgi:hypothetical protein
MIASQVRTMTKMMTIPLLSISTTKHNTRETTTKEERDERRLSLLFWCEPTSTCGQVKLS